MGKVIHVENEAIKITAEQSGEQSNIENPTRCNNNNLLISEISSTCSGHPFAHFQERKTEIFYSIWYSENEAIKITAEQSGEQCNIENPTRCNNNNLLISEISSTCSGHSFAHFQERKTEIFYSIWYSVATSFIPYTQCHVAALRIPAYHNNRTLYHMLQNISVLRS